MDELFEVDLNTLPSDREVDVDVTPFVKGIATTFGYNDKEDNGVGAWGDTTNNPEIKGVSLPRSVLKERFGNENKAHRKLVEVRNPETGISEILPIVDKGPADWVVKRQGNTIDLTHAANQALGGSGKTAMEWRFVDDDKVPNAQSGESISPPKEETKWTDYLPRVSGLGGDLAATTISIPALEKDKEVEVDLKTLPSNENNEEVEVDLSSIPQEQQSVENQNMIDLPAKNILQKALGKASTGNEGAKYLENVYANVWGNGLDDKGPKPWEEIETEIPKSQKENEGDYWLSKGLLDAVETIPNILRAAPDAAKNALIGGAMGAGLAGWVGQLGPQVLTPEEAITVPVAFATGVEMGAATGAGEYWRKIGTASMYDSMRREGIPNEIAKPIAETLGVPYSALEFAQLSHFIPASGRKMAGKIVADNIKETLGRVAKETGKEYSWALGQEIIQDLIQDTGLKIGQIQSGIESNKQEETVGTKIWNTIKQAALPTAFLMGPKVAIDTANSIVGYNKSVPNVNLNNVSLNNQVAPVNLEPQGPRPASTFQDFRNKSQSSDYNLYAVDPYWSKLNNLVGENKKKRKLEESAKNNPSLSPEIKPYLGTDYFQLSNEKTIAEAKQSLIGKDINDTYRELRDAPLNPLTFAQTLETVSELKKQGRDLDAAELILNYSEKSTKAGQAVQALKFMSLLDENGIQFYGAKAIEQAANVDPVVKNRYENIKRIRREVSDATQVNAEDSLTKADLELAVEDSLSKVMKPRKTNFQNVIKNNLKIGQTTIWDKYIEQAASRVAGSYKLNTNQLRPMLADFTNRLTQQLASRHKFSGEKGTSISKAAMIGEALRNQEKYGQVWTEVKKKIKKKYKDYPEIISQLEVVLQDALTDPYSYVSVSNAINEEMKGFNLKAKEILLSNTETKQEIKNNLKNLIIEKADVSGQEAERLSQKVSEIFEEKQRLEKDNLLKQMTRQGESKEKQVPSKIQKLINLNNAGALTDERFYTELSRVFDVPAWTAEMSRKIGELQKDFANETDPDMQLYKGAKMFSVINESIPKDVMQQVSAIQNLSILLNPKTSIRNILGNTIMWGANGGADIASIPADMLVKQFWTNKRSVSGLQIAESLKGLAQPIVDFNKSRTQGRLEGMSQWEAFKQGIDYTSTMGQLASQNKWDLQDMRKMNQQVFSNKWLNMSEKTLGLTMGVADRMFAMSAYRGSLARQMEAAKLNGLDATVPSPEMVLEAQMDAQRAIFQDENMISNGLKNIKRDLNEMFFRNPYFGVANLYGLLFSQVPGSVLNRAIEFSPIGFIKAGMNAKDLYALNRADLPSGVTQKQFVESFSKALVGSGTTLLGLWLYNLGIISGAAEEDKDLEAMRQASGIGKYSINASALQRAITSGNWTDKQKIQPFDIQYNYDWAQPISVPVAIGAEIAHLNSNKLTNKATDKSLTNKQGLNDWQKIKQALMVGGEIAGSALQTYQELSFLSGIANTYNNFQDGPGEGFFLSATDSAQSFIPSFIKQVNDYINHRYFNVDTFETRGGDITEQGENRFLSKIPGVSKETQVPKIDVFGEAQMRYGYGGNLLWNVFFSPAMKKVASGDPAIQEVNRLFDATGDTSLIPRKVNKNVSFKYGDETIDFPLTNQEIADYQKMVGQTYLDQVYQTMQDPEFAKQPALLKAETLGKIKGQIGEIAKMIILNRRGYDVQSIEAEESLKERAKALIEMGAMNP
jgi:hypothetical protein